MRHITASTPKLVAISTTISIAIVYILVDYAISHCSYATENVLIVTATIIAINPMHLANICKYNDTIANKFMSHYNYSYTCTYVHM